MAATTASSRPIPSPEPASLERRRPFDAAAIIVANVIGGGILFFPPGIAANTPTPGSSCRRGSPAGSSRSAVRWRTRSWPRCGRARVASVYLREAYGGLAGFLTGWTSFIAGFAGAIAANAMIVPFYLERFAPGAASSTPWLQIPLPYLTLTLSTQGMIAIAIVWLLAMIHIRGVGPGRVVSNALTILKVVASSASSPSASP